MQNLERIIEFEFVRATENAALNSIHWLGRGEKETADEAACDAIYGVFDVVDICGEVVIGEGIKDNAPGIFLGDRLGTWKAGSPRFDIALDPIDGTTNISKGLPNSISVIAGAQVEKNQTQAMRNLPGYYSHKLAYGPDVAQSIKRKPGLSLIDLSLEETLKIVAKALDKRVAEVVVVILDRPRNQAFIDTVRRVGASLRMVGDGDITAAVAPSLHDSGVDLYVGIGGTPEGILTAAALKCLGGGIEMRMWFPNEEARKNQRENLTDNELDKIYDTEELVSGKSSIFCATGISDSPLLPGVKLIGKTATTHSILMRAKSRTVRYIRAVHNLEHKTIPLRSSRKESRI